MIILTGQELNNFLMKFEVKAKSISKNTWVKGMLKYEMLLNQFYVIEDRSRLGEIDLWEHLVKPLSICKYTGLIDSKGNQWYEGDVCKCNDPEDNSEFVIVWQFSSWCKKYKGWDESYRYNKIEPEDLDLFDKVGNVYD